MHLLLVDDDNDVLVITCMLLEMHGHTVDLASDGAVALARVQERAPDAVLLDLNMPVMNGFETARRMRTLPATADVLIVAVSGYVGDKEWCDRAIACGVDDCMGKPLDYEKLAALLSQRRAAPQKPA